MFSLDDSRHVKRFGLFVVVPLVIALVAAFAGMFLPIAAYEVTHSETFHPHNVFWESIFGIGFYVAAFVCHAFSQQYILSRAVGVVGMLLWPLLMIIVIFLASRFVLRRSFRTRLIWGTAFLLSLFICVGHHAANYLAVRGVPLFWNYYAVWF